MIDVDNYHGDTYRLCSTRVKPSDGMDRLSRYACAALEAGMSYGKYMAMHGYHLPIQADTEAVDAPQGISKICPQCGKEFTNGKIKQKIYCSLECQKAHANSASHRRYRDRKAAADAG